MNKRIRTRSLIILVITVLSVVMFAGFPPTRAGMKKNLRLGLDLQGGTQVVLEVVVDDAIKTARDQTIQTLQEQLQKDNITVRQVIPAGNLVDTFEIRGLDPARDSDFRNILAGTFPEWDMTSLQGEVPNSYSLKLKGNVAEQYRVLAVDQALHTIETRINALGVAEPIIQKRVGVGQHQIIVQFPGVDDPEYVKTIIGKPAILELKLAQGGTYPTRQAALQQFGGALPPTLEILESSKAENGAKVYYVVNKIARVTGRDLKNAGVSRDTAGRPAVTFDLNAAGAQKFGKLTEENINKPLAIVLDNMVVSAPNINSRITDRGEITGGGVGFTPEEAQDLAFVLKSGALPARMEYLQQAVVGASLGADSVRSGIIASLVALGSVVVFVLFYYRASGINATIAMILNLVILFGLMAYLSATLTLPGIAGVILTIGVGIDSNVLIFERIREELRAGKTVASSVATSFQRVFLTLVDTHLAALISALFLFVFGTSAIKGFAVTLVIGLVANMFTAVFVSRTLFEIVLSRKGRAETISI